MAEPVIPESYDMDWAIPNGLTYEEWWTDNINKENPNSLGNKFLNIFTGNGTRYKSEWEQKYNSWSQAQQQRYEYELARSLRSTEYQDALKDIQAAGLNPYVLLSGGQFGPSSQGYSTGTTALKFNNGNKESNARGFAALMYLFGRVLAAAIGKK